MLVVEKPVNMPVQEDSSGDLNLLTACKDYLKEKYNKPGAVYLGLVHRLDRPVGGAMVFARTSKAAGRLSDQLRRKEIQRSYLAVVRSQNFPSISPDQNWQTLEDYLYKVRSKNQSYVVPANHPQAKKAILHYRCLETTKDLALLEIKLETGRSHQIRVQLSHIGLALWGDQKYDPKHNQPGQQLALWAHQLCFKHPTKKESLTFKSWPQGPIWQNFIKTKA